MAEEKKPKIDLKARLGKTAVGGATPPPPAAGLQVRTPAPPTPGNDIPVPAAAAASSSPALRGAPPPGIPVGPPPGFGRSPGAFNLDPSNPLAAAIAPPARPAAAAPPAPPQPRRIEVDEMAVQEARKGARKQGLVMGLVVALVLAAVGYIAGVSITENNARKQSVGHAQQLAAEVDTSKGKLNSLAEKLEGGRKDLREKKFPDTLAKDLGGINVDFDGGKLTGVRFSGFNKDTTTGLIEFITAVQSINDRRNAIIGLLNRLGPQIKEQFAAASKPPPVRYVVLINKDTAQNPFGILAPLVKPMELSANMPPEFTATNPRTRANVTAPKLATLEKGGAAYVVPDSIESACPSETVGQVAQLGGQLGRIISEIRGEKATPEYGLDDKIGLLQRADLLSTNLKNVKQ